LAKAKTVFFCGSCGYESSKWMGRCPGCGEWNTFIEEKTPPPGADRGWDAFEQRPAQLLQEIPRAGRGDHPRFAGALWR